MTRTRRKRDELFPADRGLMARMVAAAILTPLTIVALLLVLFVPLHRHPLALAAVAALGTFKVVGDLRRRPVDRVLADGEEPELAAIVDRLCVVGDLPRPEVVVHEDVEPNSWIVDPPRRRPRLHVTRGLMDLLEPAELEAVVAHELAHVANRDATVMTVVALPVEALRRGGDSGSGWGWPLLLAGLAAEGIAFVAGFGSTALSRYRELTADAGAAAMTGRPMALASALMKVDGALAAVPLEDLRLAAGCDTLRLIAVDEPEGIWRHQGPTHPSVEQRVVALERMEHALAHRRRVAT